MKIKLLTSIQCAAAIMPLIMMTALLPAPPVVAALESGTAQESSAKQNRSTEPGSTAIPMLSNKNTSPCDHASFGNNTLAVATTTSAAHTNNEHKTEHRFNGNVSWYGAGFNGKKTASGEPFDMNKLIAAHLSLPFGTRVQVEDPKNGSSVIVVVKDRGPYVKTRIMDVSREAGRRLGILRHGVGYMYCLVLED